jgi:hypothetical protein
VENKCRFFCWLLLHNRLWTSDRVLAHGGQGNGVCNLCFTHQETALHMLARCPYSKAVWQGWLGINLQRPPCSSYRKLQGWWNSMIQLHEPGADARAQKMVYTAWNIWKERCRHVFDNNGLDVVVLQGLILHDVAQWQAAWRSNTLARRATT